MIQFEKYWAPWCGPCKMLAPTIDGIKGKYPSVTFTDINVDESQDIAREAGIRNIPFVVIKKDGVVVDRIAGLNPASVYEQKLNNLI